MDLVLCRDVYHCTPTELAAIPAQTVLAHLACIGVENKVSDMRHKSAMARR